VRAQPDFSTSPRPQRPAGWEVAAATLAALLLAIAAHGAWRARAEAGEVKARLAPRGKIWVHGEYWNAEGEAAQDVEVGEMVKVVGVEGMTLKVKRAAA